jgi:outer membrane putative beta-barrel porin/alpha-amylase
VGRSSGSADAQPYFCGVNPIVRSNPVRKNVARTFSIAAIVVASLQFSTAQDLAPRAYVITPAHSNALTVSNSFFTGELLFNGVLPITDANATINAQTLTYYRSLSFFGRSANVTATVPYGLGTFRGNVMEQRTEVYRSGMLDSVYRFSVNLKGGPAMSLDEFRTWHQTLIIGASIRVVAPTGQYDFKRLINCGSNRWAFKPELGVSKRRGHWILDAYAGMWFFTANPKFFSENEYVTGTTSQSQKPIMAFEGHFSYDVKPRLWVSLDGNYWRGGRTSLNGVENPDTLQANSRIGATASVPLSTHHSVKLSYNYGAYIKFGGNYHNVSAGWQYSWIGKPFQFR